MAPALSFTAAAVQGTVPRVGDGGSNHAVTASNFPSLSAHQWNNLLTLLNNQSNANKLSGRLEHLYILDLECSPHMTGKQDLLMNLPSISPYTIGLPNGTEATSSQ